MQTSFDFFDNPKVARHVVNNINERGVFVDFEEVIIPGSPTVKILLSSDGADWYCGVHITLESQGVGFRPRVMTQSYPSRAVALAAGATYVDRVCASADTKRAKEVLELLKIVA